MILAPIFAEECEKKKLSVDKGWVDSSVIDFISILIPASDFKKSPGSESDASNTQWFAIEPQWRKVESQVTVESFTNLFFNSFCNGLLS